MQPARTRMSGVTVAVALLAILTPFAQAATRSGDRPGPSLAASNPGPRLIVPFGAPAGYLFTVRPAATAALRAAGATPLMPAAGIWRVSGSAGPALAARLSREGSLVAVDRNLPRRTRAADPLRTAQYAFGSIRLPAIGPAPSRKILIIDTGLDVTHPDIAARAPGTTVLANHQDVSGIDGDVEWHGTAVASTIGAAVDGSGGEGVFPGATIAMWDASMHPMGVCKPGGCLDGASIVAGINWAISHHYNIISMSFGSPDGSYPEYLAIQRAIAHGILMVAAAGNEAQSPPNDPNPYEYPAAYEHVVSVAASDSTGAWASFSNFLPTNDVSAPGVDVYAAIAQGFDITDGGRSTPTCDPLPGLAQPGWCKVDGTSFATPITSAAAAWVWSKRRGLTALQLADVLRAGARPGKGQVGGFDDRFGFGLLDVTGALQAKTPRRDLLEPNGDVPMVTGRGGFGKLQPAIMRATQRRAHITASADYAKDFEDVYRVEVPRGAKRLKLFLRHRGGGHRSDDLNICAYRASVVAILLDTSATRRARLGCSTQRGATSDSLSIRLKKGTRRVYVEVYAPQVSGFADTYTLTLARS